MQTWVCYDISDDRRREHVASTLFDFGSRVEESVFQCRIDPSLAEKMLARLQRAIEPSADKVHVLTLCETCCGRVQTLGQATQAADAEYLIV